jgi:hypothetical protein
MSSVSTREMLNSPAESNIVSSLVFRGGIPPTEFPVVSTLGRTKKKVLTFLYILVF